MAGGRGSFRPDIFSNGDPASSLTLEYRKAMPGLDYQLQWSSSLLPQEWFETGVGAETYFPPTDTYRRSVPVSPAEDAKFIRLKISN